MEMLEPLAGSGIGHITGASSTNAGRRSQWGKSPAAERRHEGQNRKGYKRRRHGAASEYGKIRIRHDQGLPKRGLHDGAEHEGERHRRRRISELAHEIADRYAGRPAVNSPAAAAPARPRSGVKDRVAGPRNSPCPPGSRTRVARSASRYGPPDRTTWCRRGCRA